MTKPLPKSKFRDDITVIGVPLTEICNREYTDPRQRQLFKNIIYVGALRRSSTWTLGEIERLIGEQYKGKEKLIDANMHALHLGRDWVMVNLACPIGLRLKRANAVGDRIFIEGNAQPRSAPSMAARRSAPGIRSRRRPHWQMRSPATAAAARRSPHQEEKVAIIQAEDELASIGIVIGAAWNGARAFTATSGPGSR